MSPGYLSNEQLVTQLSLLDEIILFNRANSENLVSTQKDYNDLRILRGISLEEIIIRKIELIYKTPQNLNEIIKINAVNLKNYIVSSSNTRILYPKNKYFLWAQHKYSVMARNYQLYKDYSKIVNSKDAIFDEIFISLSNLLWTQPDKKNIKNTLQHLWGYISKDSTLKINELNYKEQLKEIQFQSLNNNVEYLLQSTVLSDLMYWINTLE